MTVRQATRVRFHGGDPLALTKRIEARRSDLGALARMRQAGSTGFKRIDASGSGKGDESARIRIALAHPRQFQAEPAEKVTPLRIAGMVVFVIVMFGTIAITGPIFAAAMGLR